MYYNGIKDTNVILESIFNAMPDDTEYSIDLYPAPEGSEDDELYFAFGGMCYRVTATPHPHPDKGNPEDCLSLKDNNANFS